MEAGNDPKVTGLSQRPPMRPDRMLRLLFASAVVLASGRAGAADISPTGFLVRLERTMAAPPARVYDALVGQVGCWWNPQHTYSGDSKNLSIDPRPGGCFCERLPNGGVEHMRVVLIRANEMVRMIGGLGPLQGSGVSGSMTWRLSPTEKGSKLELTYSVGDSWPAVSKALHPQWSVCSPSRLID
jgi:uncharacterized protein YndB with AHSA1/START domain